MVKVIEVHYFHHLVEWSSDSISLKGTEAEMVNHLTLNAEKLLGIRVAWFQRELRTSAGAIDVVFVDYDDVRHVVEVKRRRTNVGAVYQLKRYMDYLEGVETRGYLAAPSATDNAMAALDISGYKFIELDPEVIWPGENIQ